MHRGAAADHRHLLGVLCARAGGLCGTRSAGRQAEALFPRWGLSSDRAQGPQAAVHSGFPARTAACAPGHAGQDSCLRPRPRGTGSTRDSCCAQATRDRIATCAQATWDRLPVDGTAACAHRATRDKLPSGRDGRLCPGPRGTAPYAQATWDRLPVKQDGGLALSWRRQRGVEVTARPACSALRALCFLLRSGTKTPLSPARGQAAPGARWLGLCGGAQQLPQACTPPADAAWRVCPVPQCRS